MSPPPRVIGQKTAQEAVERCATGRSRGLPTSCSIVATAPPLHLPCGRVGGGLGTEPASVDRHAAASRRDGRGGVACRGGGGHRWVRDRRSIYAPMSSTGPISALCPWPEACRSLGVNDVVGVCGGYRRSRRPQSSPHSSNRSLRRILGRVIASGPARAHLFTYVHSSIGDGFMCGMASEA